MKYGEVAAVRIPATIEHIVRIANAWTARPCWSKCPPVGIDTLRQSPGDDFSICPVRGGERALAEDVGVGVHARLRLLDARECRLGERARVRFAARDCLAGLRERQFDEVRH